MRFRKQAQPRSVLPCVLLACFALFAFATLIKVIQYCPHLNAKVQLSDSSRIERHQFDANSVELIARTQATADSILRLVAEEREATATPDPEVRVPLPADPFQPLISSRPPPAEI